MIPVANCVALNQSSNQSSNRHGQEAKNDQCGCHLGSRFKLRWDRHRTASWVVALTGPVYIGIYRQWRSELISSLRLRHCLFQARVAKRSVVVIVYRNARDAIFRHFLGERLVRLCGWLVAGCVFVRCAMFRGQFLGRHVNYLSVLRQGFAACVIYIA